MAFIPPHIQEEVRRYDPCLSIRWSKEKRQFILERRIANRYVEGTDGKPVDLIRKPIKYTERRERGWNLCAENSDRYIQYRNGLDGIIYFKQLDNRLFRWLSEHDSWKIRHNKVDQELLKIQEAAERQKDEKMKREFDEIGYEAYESMKREAGERISMRE